MAHDLITVGSTKSNRSNFDLGQELVIYVMIVDYDSTVYAGRDCPYTSTVVGVAPMDTSSDDALPASAAPLSSQLIMTDAAHHNYSSRTQPLFTNADK